MELLIIHCYIYFLFLIRMDILEFPCILPNPEGTV